MNDFYIKKETLTNEFNKYHLKHNKNQSMNELFLAFQAIFDECKSNNSSSLSLDSVFIGLNNEEEHNRRHNNGNSCVTDAQFYQIFQTLLKNNTIAELAYKFNRSVSVMEKVILCFGGKLPAIKFFQPDDMPEIPSAEKYTFFSLLIICFMISIIGNSVFIYCLVPFRKIFKKIPFKFINQTQTNNEVNMRKRIPPRKLSSLYNNNNNHKLFATQSIIQQQQQNEKLSLASDAYFISTSITDLFFSIAIIPLHVGCITRNGFWIFGKFMCKLYPYMTHMMLCITSLTLVTIAIERYVTIVKDTTTSSSYTNGSSCKRRTGENGNLKLPSSCFKNSFCEKISAFLRCKRSSSTQSTSSIKSVLILLSIYWLISLVLVSPYLIYTRHLPVINGSNCYFMTDEYICVNIWQNVNQITENIYKTFYWLIMFIIPGFILLYSYCSISWNLFIRTSFGSKKGSANCWRFKSKRRIIVILIFDCLFYVICWYPFSIWSIKSPIEGLFSQQNTLVTFKDHLIMFYYLYSFALINVSLKWIFRLVGSWSKFKVFIKTFNTKQNKIQPRRITVEPYIISQPNNNIIINGIKQSNTRCHCSQQQYRNLSKQNSDQHQPLKIFVKPAQQYLEREFFYQNDNGSTVKDDKRAIIDGYYVDDIFKKSNSHTKMTNLTSIRKDSKSTNFELSINNQPKNINFSF